MHLLLTNKNKEKNKRAKIPTNKQLNAQKKTRNEQAVAMAIEKSTLGL